MDDQKDKISNRTLALLLVAAIVVSLGGTLISLDRLRQVSMPGTPVKGMVTTGTITATIQEHTQLNFTDNIVNWGTITAVGMGGCYLTTEGGVGGCTGATPQNDGLTIENIGTTNMSVNISSDKNGAALVGGTGAWFAFKTAENEANSCHSGLNYTVYENITAGTRYTVCNLLRPETANDNMDLDFQLKIPQDRSLVGAQTATITGYATKV